MSAGSRGTAYIEYFVLATITAVATLWLINRLTPATTEWENTYFNAWMQRIAGS